jgi:hypothetical protein
MDEEGKNIGVVERCEAFRWTCLYSFISPECFISSTLIPQQVSLLLSRSCHILLNIVVAPVGWCLVLLCTASSVCINVLVILESQVLSVVVVDW